jgi:hypothetical protein
MILIANLIQQERTKDAIGFHLTLKEVFFSKKYIKLWPTITSGKWRQSKIKNNDFSSLHFHKI